MRGHKIRIPELRDTGRLFGPTVTVARATRWPSAGRGENPTGLAIGAAMLFHVAVCALALVFVRVPPPPSPPDDQTITLVFEPPPSPPAAAPEFAAPLETSEPGTPPEATANPPPPPDPATPPLEQTPPQAEPPPVPRLEPKPPEPPKALPPPLRKPVARARPAAPAGARELPASATAESSTASSRAQPAAETPSSADWQRSLAAWLAAHKVYPELARRRGVEGSVGLRFTADRSGRVLNVSVVSSAGSALLDAAAEKMVADATVPPFPAGMPQQTATLTVTIRYALSN